MGLVTNITKGQYQILQDMMLRKSTNHRNEIVIIVVEIIVPLTKVLTLVHVAILFSALICNNRSHSLSSVLFLSVTG